MFVLPPGLLPGGFRFANMWSAGYFKHMLQGGFRVDDDSNKHIFFERGHLSHRPFYMHSSAQLWLCGLTP